MFRRRRRKGGIAKNLCFGEGVKKEMDLYSCKQAYNFIKLNRLALLLGALKDLQYTPKKNYSYSALTLQVPGGF